MALQTRTVFLEVRVLPSGDLQKWTREDIYDDAITPVAHVDATFNKDGSMKTPTIQAVSDIRNLGIKRCVTIPKDEPIPEDVQAFLDNSK